MATAMSSGASFYESPSKTGHSQMKAENFSLWAVFSAQRSLLAIVVIFGVFVNLLVLTGPIFALQVYDRVLSSRSQETLVALVILMGFLFLVMGILDHARKRIAARIGERMVSLIDERVFKSVIRQQSQSGQPRPQVFSDLETLRQFFASATFAALLDLPWFPVFIFCISLFHPALGWLSAFGALVFILPGLVSLLLRGPGHPGETEEYHQALSWTKIAFSDPEMIHGMNVQKTVIPQWSSLRELARSTALNVQDRRTQLVSIAHTFRMFLQSAFIAMAAYLVLKEQLTAGAILAASVLLSRALSPLDLISQNVLTLKSQLGAWRRISIVLNETPEPRIPTLRYLPGRNVQVDQITVFPPGARRAALRMVKFDLRPGQAVGVIGPSGAGKSALARAIIGQWPVAGGQIRIGGIQIDQSTSEVFADHIGYLPQQLRFLDGTIAQNVSRFSTGESRDTVVNACIVSGAHDMILSLPAGYQTLVGTLEPPLPGGLVQRIGLARAIFGEPELLVLDEPANNLDADGQQALQDIVCSTIAMGRSAIILTHRPAILSNCETVLVLDAGTQKAYGPKNHVLKSTVLPHPATRAVSNYGGSA